MAEPFDSMVSGIAADEDAVAADLRADLQAEGSTIANLSPFSSFFRLLAAIFAAPVLWLRGFVIDTFLPGIFATRATSALLDLRAADQDVTRKPAQALTGLITFFRTGTIGDLEVPLGTVVETPPIGEDGTVYRVVTTEAGTIPDGESNARVQVAAEAAGAAYNLGEGFYSVLASPVAGINQVKNEADYILLPGADIETDAALQERLQLLWRRQSGWHTGDTYRSLISDVIGIDPANIFFDTAAPRGPGSADAYILTDFGIPDAALVQAADDHINVEGNHGLGDDLQVKAMPALLVAIDVQIEGDGDLTQAERDQLAADVADLLRAAFRESAAYPDVPRVAPFQRVARSALGGAIHEAFGASVVAVDWVSPAADPDPAMALPVIQRAALDAAPVTDEGGGLVGLPATGHGFAAGTRIVVSGSVNYDGIHTVDPASSADSIVVTAAYLAETLTGAETAVALVVEVA
jgi:uncharacterized phage protein gp47/JayE